MSAQFELTASPAPQWLIGATGFEAICQNIRCIILTMCWSVPLDRAFAHDGRPLDSPAPSDTARLTSRIIDAIEKYEPRVKVESLDFVYADGETQLMEGTLTPRVVFSLRKGVEI